LENAYRDADVRLIESSGGAFEVTVDGALVFSKLRLGRHPREGEVRTLIDSHRGEHR
jgi:selT/selW/selH-like putative selenoprotein